MLLITYLVMLERNLEWEKSQLLGDGALVTLAKRSPPVPVLKVMTIQLIIHASRNSESLKISVA